MPSTYQNKTLHIQNKVFLILKMFYNDPIMQLKLKKKFKTFVFFFFQNHLFWIFQKAQEHKIFFYLETSQVHYILKLIILIIVLKLYAFQ